MESMHNGVWWFAANRAVFVYQLEQAMRMNTVMVGVALVGLLAAGAQAQVLGTVTVSPGTAKVGEAVTVTATVDVLNSNYCGFVVGFGDGTFVDGVSNAGKPSPFTFSHSYAKPGAYHITLGGKNVQSHPNCGGGEKAVDLKVAGGTTGKAAAPAAAPVAAGVAGAPCAAPWKLVAKSRNAKTGAYTCSAKVGTAMPSPNPSCPGDLSYFENAKKGQYGCRP